MKGYALHRKIAKTDLTNSEYVSQDIVEQIKGSFYEQPNYCSVYKNGVDSVLYDVLIGDGDKEDKAVGYKRLISYPYDTPQFQTGDVINIESIPWLLISVDDQFIYNVSGKIVQCNNTMKWYDGEGELHSEPCVINDVFNTINIDQSSYIDLAKGQIRIRCQNNLYTEKIKIDDRFVFNKRPYKVIDNSSLSSSGLLNLLMLVDQLHEDDDLANGIADTSKAVEPEPPSGGWWW